MKINPAHIDKLYGSAAADSAVPASREEARRSAIDKDHLELSDAARGHSEIDTAVKMAVAESEKPASAEKLLRYKDAIQNGTYRVSSQDIAAALLNTRSGGID